METGVFGIPGVCAFIHSFMGRGKGEESVMIQDLLMVEHHVPDLAVRKDPVQVVIN